MFTLKNPSYPEYIRFTDVSVLTLSMHPTQSNLIAVGKYDGNIAIYNKNHPDKEPQYQSNSVTNKHLGPISQVCVSAAERVCPNDWVPLRRFGGEATWRTAR